MNKTLIFLAGVVALLVLVGLVAAFSIFGTYNRLVTQEQSVQAQWAQVENVYQRRADLIPNLVSTVRGAADFERSTLQDVVEARSRVGQIAATPELLNDPQAFQRFQQAQDELSGALSRLLVVVERYPQLGATQAFRDLQAQLEGTENRIAVERRRFNEVARDFNAGIRRVPAAWYIGWLGWDFQQKAYFESEPGSDEPPEVEFDFE